MGYPPTSPATPLRQRHRPISSVHLDELAVFLLATCTTKDELEMFPIAFLVPLRQHAHGQLENVQLGYASTSVAQSSRGSGIHGQGGDFGDGVPAGGAHACGGRGIVSVDKTHIGEACYVPDIPE